MHTVEALVRWDSSWLCLYFARTKEKSACACSVVTGSRNNELFLSLQEASTMLVFSVAVEQLHDLPAERSSAHKLLRATACVTT